MIQIFKKESNSMTKPEVVIFDWDDTLIKSGNIFHLLFEKVMKDLDVSDDVRVIREKYKHYSLKEAFPLIFSSDWKKAQKLYYKHLSQMDLSNIETMENAKDALDHFASSNVTMVVVSNKNGVILREEVKRLGWHGYFQCIVGASDAKRDKPWPEPAELALSGLKFSSPSKVWFVGDSTVDARCSNAIMSQFVLFGNNGTDKEVENIQIPYLHAVNHKELISSYNTAK